jgi:hypothetical protein
MYILMRSIAGVVIRLPELFFSHEWNGCNAVTTELSALNISELSVFLALEILLLFNTIQHDRSQQCKRQNLATSVIQKKHLEHKP